MRHANLALLSLRVNAAVAGPLGLLQPFRYPQSSMLCIEDWGPLIKP